MQIQADSEGLDRWGAKDRRRQGLLLEIRASLVDLKAALDQAAGASPGDSSLGKVPLLPALNRAESAFSNYAASLTEPTQPQTTALSFGRSSIAMVAADSSAGRDGNPDMVSRLGMAHSLDPVIQRSHLPGAL